MSYCVPKGCLEDSLGDGEDDDGDYDVTVVMVDHHQREVTYQQDLVLRRGHS